MKKKKLLPHLPGLPEAVIKKLPMAAMFHLMIQRNKKAVKIINLQKVGKLSEYCES